MKKLIMNYNINMIMIMDLYNTFSLKGSNALYNGSEGGVTGNQLVKAPMAVAVLS